MELVMEERKYMVSKNMEKDIWKIMYDKAREVQNEREISPFIEAGGVAAAILTKSGNIYVGVCIDTASTLGMCAERNAIANMITHKDNKIEKTSNKIENAFQKKTMPKSRKRTFKTKQGVLKRIYRRDLIWNPNRKTDFENQQSF